MNDWRQRAVGLFPDLHEDLHDPETTIYLFFSDLLDRVRDAHHSDSYQELNRIYSFAEWCSEQKDQDTWNAAGVSFYEHLVDDPITLKAIPHWLSKHVFEDVCSLFEARMDSAAYRELRNNYFKNGSLPERPKPPADEACGPADWSI